MHNEEKKSLSGQGLDIIKTFLTSYIERIIKEKINFEVFEFKAFWIPLIRNETENKLVRITPYVIKNDKNDKWECWTGKDYTLERPAFIKENHRLVEIKNMADLFENTQKEVNNNGYPRSLFEFEQKIGIYGSNNEAEKKYVCFLHLKYEKFYFGTAVFVIKLKENKKKQNKNEIENEIKTIIENGIKESYFYKSIVFNFWQVILTELIITRGNVREAILYLLPPFYDKFQIIHGECPPKCVNFKKVVR